MRTLVVVVAMAALASCGGGDQTCSGPAACGGEIAPGRYRVQSYCASVHGSIKSAGCPSGISLSSSDVTATGTYTFNADKTVVTDVTVSGTIVEVIPNECLISRGMRVTCAQIGASVQGNADPGMKVSCSGEDACVCQAVASAIHTMERGTYATSGTTLTLTSVTGDVSNEQYCATPTSISMVRSESLAPGTSVMNMLTGTGSLVLVKE